MRCEASEKTDEASRTMELERLSCRHGRWLYRIVALISLLVGTVMDYAIGPYQGKGTGETSLFSTLLSTLSKGHLLLADRYYCTYAIVALLLEGEVPALFINRVQKKPDFWRGQKLAAKNYLIVWHKPPRKPVWMSKADYARLTDEIQVREFAKVGLVYATTLVDNNHYDKIPRELGFRAAVQLIQQASVQFLHFTGAILKRVLDYFLIAIA